MQPHDDGPTGVVEPRAPDVQIEAVLALRLTAALDVRPSGRDELRRRVREFEGRALAVPGRVTRRWTEASLAGRRSRVGDASKDRQSFLRGAAESAVAGTHHSIGGCCHRSLPSPVVVSQPSSVGLGIVTREEIVAEVTVRVAPDGMDVVRVVLGVVVLDHEALAL